MKIIIAPDSFKESISATDASNAIEKGLQKILPKAEYIKIPVADGGEGSLDAIAKSLAFAQNINIKIKAPLGNTLSARYLINQDLAIIELAQSCGINLYKKKQRNPLKASTFGFGQIITDALDRGIKKFVLTLGGSGTNDVGLGLLQALGVNFLNKKNEPIEMCNLNNIDEIKTINLSFFDSRIKDCTFKIACDVSNPLCGKNGATLIFGKQKGLKNKDLENIDNKIKTFAKLCQKVLNKDLDNIAGTGAAGGVGFALATFLNAELVSGAELVLDTIKFDDHLSNTDIVIIGEGKMDKQSLYGKIPITVAKRAKKQGVNKVIAIVGSYNLEENDIDNSAIDAIFSTINYYTDLETILSNASKNIEQTASNIAKLLM